VALAGWRAENLVGRIDDLVIYPGTARPTAGRALFEQIESRDPTALIGLPLIWVASALRAVGLDCLGVERES